MIDQYIAFSYTNLGNQLEFFIPALKIKINSKGVFQALHPLNIPSVEQTKFYDVDPVSSITIPQELFHEIRPFSKNIPYKKKEKMQGSGSDNGFFKGDVGHLYKKLQEIQPTRHLTPQPENPFWKDYTTHGNRALKEVLLKFICSGTLPQNVELQTLMRFCLNLHGKERKSMVYCIDYTLKNENIRLIEHHELAAKNNTSQYVKYSWYTAAIPVIFFIFELNPLFGAFLFFWSNGVIDMLKESNQPVDLCHEMKQIDDRKNFVIHFLSSEYLKQCSLKEEAQSSLPQLV